jgi:exodeoxyribonuclease V alpha subunit
MEEIFGYVDGVVFAEEERGFTVAKLKEPRKAEPTCIVGTMPSLQPGESIRCKGTWKRHAQYGLQFEVQSFEVQAPSDLIGIQKYLESGMIKGIGKAYAERIVKEFGMDTLKIIDESPERLAKVPGIGEKRVERIRSCWQDQKGIRDVMVFLRGHGVSPGYAQKIFRTYGERSVEKVKDNPYGLAKEIFGIGFKSADAIAQNLGIPRESPLRIKSGIEHVLWELSNEGHVCYPRAELILAAGEVLESDPSLIDKCLELLIKEGEVIQDELLVWVRPLYLAEIGIGREMARLTTSPLGVRAVHVEKALIWVQEKLRIKLAEEQIKGVSCGVSDKVHIITGGPGTGKSTITKAILAINEKITDKILLAAPTGRAAKRMSEITHKKAFTIHALLEMDFSAGGFKRNRDNPLACDLIIIDEASMIDVLLMNHLLKAIPSHARVLLIGDIDQLPSVGPGNVLKDMIGSTRIRVTELKQIFRQAAGSRIVTNAHRINHGEFPDLSPRSNSDFAFIECETPEQIMEEILKLIKVRIPKEYRFHRFEDIQVLSPMRRGVIGTENLNAILQEQLNPQKEALTRMGRRFQVGDKVMQIRNNYQKLVFNGDIGKIVEIDMSEQMIKVAFDGKLIDYDFSEIDELVLAYAVSIHKYQGSECPCIIIPVHTSHFKLLYRNLLYTGITRGKKLVILVGSKKAIAIAIHNEEVRKRHTGLKNTLCKFLT